MIQSSELQNRWKKIQYSGKSEFEFIRIDSGISIPEMSIGLNSSLNKCLLLELPKNYNVDFQKSIKQNLTLYFFKDTNFIVLELTDKAFEDLFDDLIISIYQHIYQLSDVDKYSKIFIAMFYKWSEFFDDKKVEKHSLDIIKGLYGELFILYLFIKECNSSHLNDLLMSWKGPYDCGHDFVLDNKNIEVKTKETIKNSINISSEYQLEDELKKELELYVISVETNSENAMSLSKLLELVKNMVINKMGDFSIILTALLQKNITIQNIHIYDNFQFEVIEIAIYDCLDESFPKLTKSNTPKAIGSIQYTLYLDYLNDFLVSKRKFLNERY